MTFPANRHSASTDDLSAGSTGGTLVGRVRAGDVVAFEWLFRAHWAALYRYAYRYLRSPDESEEVVQTVFARMWRLRSDLKINGPVQSYLYLAVRNASLDRLKHDALARKWRERQVGALRAGDVASPESDGLLRGSEIEAAIERSLAELPAKRRQICELRFVGDLSYAEIAKQLGITTKTVETQIARGLKVMRERLRRLVD